LDHFGCAVLSNPLLPDAIFSLDAEFSFADCTAVLPQGPQAAIANNLLFKSDKRGKTLEHDAKNRALTK
jgi:hypothetical protein